MWSERDMVIIIALDQLTSALEAVGEPYTVNDHCDGVELGGARIPGTGGQPWILVEPAYNSRKGYRARFRCCSADQVPSVKQALARLAAVRAS